jgi:tRNA-binding protein
LATVDEISALDIRVGTIASARVLRGARKPSYALTVDFGELGTKSAAARIAGLYEVEDLVGLQVVAIVNVPPKDVAGFLSESIVLVAADGKGESVLLMPERPVPDGGRVD